MFQMSFTGNIGAEVYFAYSPTGQAFAKFTVAVNAGGDKPPLWIKVVCFGKSAEILANSGATKGNRVVVCVDQPAVIEIYEKKGGGVGTTLEVKASWVEALTSPVVKSDNVKSR